MAAPVAWAGALDAADVAVAAIVTAGAPERRGGPEVTRPSPDVGGADTRDVGTTVGAAALVAGQDVVRGPVAQLGRGAVDAGGPEAVDGRGGVPVALSPADQAPDPELVGVAEVPGAAGDR